MSNYPVNTLSGVIAASGDKRIPPATAAAAGLGRLSQEKGFGQTNSKPLEQGGVPPFREDFNGIFNLFSQFLLWYQQGGIMKYNVALDYEVGNEIIYQNNKYRCIQNNGPATTVKAPSDTSYWEKLVNTPGPYFMIRRNHFPPHKNSKHGTTSGRFLQFLQLMPSCMTQYKP